ncbi:hypothetical protein F441_03859 [Phytophthora nicotianae CJ01A1]|uniref:Uncharacterized protein n=4 Tax=Phytophthora nicotianae TaxID=4792 RepID=V9FPY6_PHYNI|nr:hypothetical protein F443_03882 [Phytophthora nicotianae P1569]ETK92982.1 hypothetical protein L915_03765 [Phytophthora nicotianae]ETL46409.1 hypothetical protein L916_03702 [Phytophthora nicotianae]ETP22933.1 hypothetical protein F441_03859 [Phytophthora nicotianae CJ01A1]ETP50924.1 hypothetical protein F442_03867 [Phytophthora nicotianae P10297]
MSTERVSMCYLKETYKEYENVKVKQLPEVDDFGALREGGSPNLFTKQHIGLVLQYAAIIGWTICVAMLLAMGCSRVGDPYFLDPSDRYILPSDYTPDYWIEIEP